MKTTKIIIATLIVAKIFTAKAQDIIIDSNRYEMVSKYIYEPKVDTIYSQLIYTDCDSCQLKVMLGYSIERPHNMYYFSNKNTYLFNFEYLDKFKKPLPKNIVVIISRKLNN